mgnify:CR=1 FL=1
MQSLQLLNSTVQPIALGPDPGREQSQRGLDPMRGGVIKAIHADDEPDGNGNDADGSRDGAPEPPILGG